MPYPEPQQLLDKLPNAGQGLSEPEARAYINRWKARLEFEPADDREWTVAETVIETGAMANLMRDQYRRSGISTAEADALAREAKDLLTEYNGLRYTEGREEPKGYVISSPF